MPERKPAVTLPRNWFVALIVGVCVLSAGIGSGVALLAEEGPAGPRGERGARGPAGPPGPAGESATAEVKALKDEVEELRGRLDKEDSLQRRLEELESEVSSLGGLSDRLCEELDVFC